ALWFWDILTAVALTDREIVTIQDYHLEVVLDEENHEGETIPIEGESNNTQVAIDADREAFETKFLEIVNPRTETTTQSTSELESTDEKTPIDIVQWIMGLICVTLIVTRKKRKS
ncbi:MAG: hypothetical protein ACW991_03565, partial [Candidatus Hodarchaeales archaeon]